MLPFLYGLCGVRAPDQASQDSEGLCDNEGALAGGDVSRPRALLPMLMASRDPVLVERRDLMQPLLSSVGRGSPYSQISPLPGEVSRILKRSPQDSHL